MADFDKNRFASKKQDWNTPKYLFDKINEEFHFDCDLAASHENALCPNFYTKQNNGLLKQWSGTCWLNPPYNTKECKVIDWVKKAYNDTLNNENLTVVMLLPARTNNKFWHDYIMRAAEIKFIRGRVKFNGAKHGLPQPLVLVVFKKSETTKFSSFYLS